jgi:hypothetical protein
VSYERETLCEPVSVGIHCRDLTGVQPGDAAVVLGAGRIGLVAARQRGAASGDRDRHSSAPARGRPKPRGDPRRRPVLDNVITDRLPLDDAVVGFDRTLNQKHHSIEVMSEGAQASAAGGAGSMSAYSLFSPAMAQQKR